MGCGASSARGESRSPYHNSTNPSTLPQTDSRIPIAQSSVSNTPQLANQIFTSALDRNDQSPRIPAASRSTPNKPLQRAPSALSIEPPAIATPTTQTQVSPSFATLLKAREEFFDTRVTGRPEMWAAIRLVCEMIEQNQLVDAQAILDASGGTCPTGQIWGRKGGIYDDRGERYVVPTWCIGRPIGFDNDEPPATPNEKPTQPEMTHASMEDGTLADEIMLFSRGSKGKARASTFEPMTPKGEQISIKIRPSHTARDMVVVIGDDDPVHLLTRKAKGESGIPDQVKVRLFHLGQPLNEQRTIIEQGWAKGHVVNMFVFE